MTPLFTLVSPAAAFAPLGSPTPRAEEEPASPEPNEDEPAEEPQREQERGTATAEKPAPTKTPPKLLPQYRVLLHNDDVNEIGYVVETILLLTPLKRPEAIKRTFEAHQRGLTLLLTTHRERAELYAEQFRSKHLTVTIEPAT